MSDNTIIESAHRDLGVEIEKLIGTRDMLLGDWKAMIKQIEELEHVAKNLRRELERERSRNAMDGGQV